jgi:hypothetical protein
MVIAAGGEAANDGFEAGLFRIVEAPFVVHRTLWSHGDDGYLLGIGICHSHDHRKPRTSSGVWFQAQFCDSMAFKTRHTDNSCQASYDSANGARRAIVAPR